MDELPEFLGTLNILHNYFSGSTNHCHLLRVQKERNEINHETHTTTLKRSCDTRWSSKYLSVKSVKANLESILEVLDERAAGRNEDSVTARGLLNAMLTVDFIFMLCALFQVLGLVDPVTKCLQRKDMDLSQAVQQIGALTESYKSLRNDTSFYELYKVTEELCKELGINITASASVEQSQSRPRRSKIPNKNMTDYVLTATDGARRSDITAPTQKLRANYFGIIDSFVAELDNRFNNESNNIFSALSTVSKMEFQFEHVKCITETFGLDEADINHELLNLKNYFKRSSSGEKKSLMEIFLEIPADFYPQTKTLVQILVTVPSTSVECERSFSCMARVKTKYRTSMLSVRLSHLAILSINKDLIDDVTVDLIVGKFASQHGRLDL